MLKARKKNRVVRIPDEKADEYKKLGYTITDENGETVFQPEDKDEIISTLRKENQQLKQQVTELELLLKQANKGKAPEQTEGGEQPEDKDGEKPAETPEQTASAPETPADDAKGDDKAKNAKGAKGK